MKHLPVVIAFLSAALMSLQPFKHGPNGAFMNTTGGIKSKLTAEIDAARRACTTDCSHELSGE